MVVVRLVDAFVGPRQQGNGAGVCVLEAEAPEEWMQAVAAEVGLSETAFAVPEDGAWSLRWFTPEREVELCGHATMAAAHVLWRNGHVAPGEAIAFETRSGLLTCEEEAGNIAMTLPIAPAVPSKAPAGLWQTLGIRDQNCLAADNENLLVPLDDVAILDALRPDPVALRRVGPYGIIVTAPGDADADYYVRYFAPSWGIDEDPATGSIQCTLAPYWAHILGKHDFTAIQRSSRGGLLRARLLGHKVLVSGEARDAGTHETKLPLPLLA